MKKHAGRILFVLGPFLGLALVFTLFVIVAPPAFHSSYNLKTIVTQTVIVAIGALGMTFVIVSGGIDLSVGSLIALGSVVVATVLNRLGGDADAVGWGVSLIAVVGGVAACGGCGLLNGFLSSWLRIVPFIVTLGMMQVARGVAKWMAHERTVFCPETPLSQLMVVEPELTWYSVAPGVWVALILLGVVAIVLRYTVFGRHVFAIGSNEQTARLCGIRVKLKRTLVYGLCGVFTGIAAVMQFAQLTLGDPTAANGLELDIIAAVVIGGGSLNGGEGSAVGTFVGALIMAVLRNGCNMLGVPNYFQEIIIGIIIVGAVGVDRLKHRITVMN